MMEVHVFRRPAHSQEIQSCLGETSLCITCEINFSSFSFAEFLAEGWSSRTGIALTLGDGSGAMLQRPCSLGYVGLQSSDSGRRMSLLQAGRMEVRSRQVYGGCMLYGWLLLEDCSPIAIAWDC